MKVLVVDDHLSNRKLLASLLHHEDHETIEAVDGKDALEDRAQLLDEACRLAVEYGRFGFAWCGWLDSSGARLQRAAWAGNIGSTVSRTSKEPEWVSRSRSTHHRAPRGHDNRGGSSR